VLKHIRRTTPARSALLGGAQGKENLLRFCVRFAHVSFYGEAGSARLAGLVLGFQILTCYPLCAAE
jgi:phage-related minor tail protein